MTDQLQTADVLQTTDVLAMLSDVLRSSESDPARISAAKLLLERIAPKEDEDARRREAEERDEAMAEARGLLAEFAALKLASLCPARAVDQSSAARANDTGRQLARLADYGGAGLGQDADGG